MPSRKAKTTTKKLSVTVQVALITVIGTIIVALITGVFSLGAPKPLPIVSTATISSTQIAILRYKVITNTNIYEQPTIAANVIESVLEGQIVETLSRDGDWMFVTYTIGSVRTTGWIEIKDLDVVK